MNLASLPVFMPLVMWLGHTFPQQMASVSPLSWSQVVSVACSDRQHVWKWCVSSGAQEVWRLPLLCPQAHRTTKKPSWSQMRSHMEENEAASQQPTPTSRHKSDATLEPTTLQPKSAAGVSPGKTRRERTQLILRTLRSHSLLVS